jgi:hypothetical protein
MNYSELLEKNLNDVVFGIEIETCFHILNKTFKNNIDAMTHLYDCMSKKSENIIGWEIIYSSTQRSSTYDKFILMPDNTVICNEGESSCVIKGEKVQGKCTDIIFFPVEIITPKLKVNKNGFEILNFVFHALLYTDNIIYSNTDTQGLHINVSHPKMDKNNFLKLWAYFEPVIFNLLSDDRKYVVKNFILLSSIKEDELFEKSKQKFSTVRNHPDRLEIRIQEGTIEYTEIYEWTLFCLIFLSVSVINPNIEYKNNIDDRFEQLLEIIVDDTVQKMLLNKYGINKKTSGMSIYTQKNINPLLQNMVNIKKNIFC